MLPLHDETDLNENRPSMTGEVGSFLWETIKVVFISLIIILPVRAYLIQPFFVKGQSMEPNFHDKDYIMVDKLSYRIHPPERGDVVIFRYPLDPKEFFIKRVIGLPGETVQIRNNKIIIINSEHPDGFVLDESYLPQYPEPMQDLTREVQAGQIFVMGDNRPHSSDSRAWGNLDESFISGKALVRLWPLNTIEKVPSVAYPSSQ